MSSAYRRAIHKFATLATVLLVFLCFASLATCQSTVAPTSGSEFESIQVLSDMPAAQMGKVMNIMSAALGVNCNHCHRNFEFADEGIAHKDTARKMLEMTFELNQKHFAGKAVVTCNTCHRGQTIPTSEMLPASLLASPADSKTHDLPLPDEVIIQTYLSKLGGTAKLQGIKNRKITAERVEPSGDKESETIWQTATGKSRTTTLYGDVAVTEGFDGKQAWKTAADKSIPLKPDEVEQIQRETALAFPLLAQDYFQEFTATKVERIAERSVYVLSTQAPNTRQDQLFFDVETGLLIRRTSSTPTVLGAFTYVVEYDDYETFAEVAIPTTSRYSVPGIRWTRRVLSVETNIALDDSLFVAPQK